MHRTLSSVMLMLGVMWLGAGCTPSGGGATSAGAASGTTGQPTGSTTSANSTSGAGAGSSTGSVGTQGGSTTGGSTSAGTTGSTGGPLPDAGPVGPSNCAAPPTADPTVLGALVEGNNQFAVSLLQALAQDPTLPGNVFVAPYTVSESMAMAYAGANGATAQQIQQVLNYPASAAAIAPAFGALNCQFTTDGLGADGGLLTVSNAFFGEETMTFLPSYEALLRNQFGAPLERVPFVADPEGARQTINSWVNAQTQGNIPALFPPDTITSDVRFVLVDSLYFKGVWARFFPRAYTNTFHLDASHTVNVPMMLQDDYVARYAHPNGFQLLEVPLKDAQVGVDLLLPDAVDGLPGLLASLNVGALDSALSSLQSAALTVELPKLHLDTQKDLKDTLVGMGLPNPFAQEASYPDFSGINGDQTLQLLRVQHEAVLTLEEDGLTASGATAVVGGSSGSSGAPPPQYFIADHPFVLLIRDLSNGSILFVAKVADPSQP